MTSRLLHHWLSRFRHALGQATPASAIGTPEAPPAQAPATTRTPESAEPAGRRRRRSEADARPLDILFLTHYFPPEGNAPASRVHEMAKRWARAGHRVRVITGCPNHPDGHPYPGYRNRLRQKENIDGIEVTRVWTLLAANRGRMRRTLNYLSYMISASLAAACSRRPDVLIATSPQFFCGVAGMIASLIKRTPFVLEIRDIWPESIRTVGAVQSSLALKPVEWLARLMYQSATRIVTVGDGYRQQLVDQGIDPDRISVITNGVDTELFNGTGPDPRLRRDYGLGGRFVCAYVGTIGMACGLEVALEAGRRLKDRGRHDIALLLVGDGAQRQALEDRAEREGLDNVVFTGRLDKRRIPALLASVDACLVHLRRKELFRYVLPSKIFEAQAMARPVLLGVEGCAAELIEQTGGGVLLEPENPDHLVEQLEHFADHPHYPRSLGRIGRDHVLRHYSRDRLADDYLRLLHRLCATAPTPRPSPRSP